MMEEFLTQQGEPGQAPPTGAENKSPSSQLPVKANVRSVLFPAWEKFVMCCAVFLE